MMIMKKINPVWRIIICLIAVYMIAPMTSCNDLLDKQPTTELGADAFWKTEDDATFALYGLYADVRPLFDRDYYFDGSSEYVRVRSGSNSTTDGNLRLGDAYRTNNYNPSGYAGDHAKMFRYLYGGVNRANYVIENVTKMLPEALPTSIKKLEAIIGEARLLRGMCYFRLITMWGDVAYFDRIILDNSEVSQLSRSPIGQIKDKIMEDFTYAVEKLPDSPPAVGRAGKPAALAFRGKLQLYWASWNRYGWPELENFAPDASAANAAYTAAAADFKAVIDNFGLSLFRGGEPGECDDLGEADKLPNYYYLFTPEANGDPEHIMVFTHGATGTNQGEELMRDFAGRNHEGSQCWVAPRFEIADRYQSTITGDFCEPLIGLNPSGSTTVDGVEMKNRFVPNSAVNPESYKDRDYRMKASIQWDFERSLGSASLKSTGWVPFVYKTWNAPITASNYESFEGFFTSEDVGLTTYNTDGTNSGYVFRKFVRNTHGDGRSNGNFNWPVMRLADVYLMYAEADNAVNGPQSYAIDLVNKIRHRGNLPPLASSKTGDADSFFSAIEQERIVELFGEGHRGFDLRRWRAIERVWCPPYDNNGVWRRDTHGGNMQRYFQNTNERAYQQCYIWKIPQSERDRNPNLTQNTPWL